MAKSFFILNYNELSGQASMDEMSRGGMGRYLTSWQVSVISALFPRHAAILQARLQMVVRIVFALI
jgi:hypothetical protein